MAARTAIASTRNVYAVSGVDQRGRIGDTSTIQALGWRPGCEVGLSLLPGAAAASVSRGGRDRIGAQGRLSLPVPVRRCLRLRPGDRVLLAADMDRELIIVYTDAALNAMTCWYAGSVGAVEA
jgi:AbrB family looped-hinge helix DNA binding protein